MKIDIDPKRELFRWGPIDGRLIYPDFFNVAFHLYGKKFKKYSWPDTLGLVYNKKILFILDQNDLESQGEKNFKGLVLNDKKFKYYYNFWLRIIKKLVQFQNRPIFKSLNKLNSAELLNLYHQWSKIYLSFWVYGFIPELANYGGEPILRRLLEKRVSAQDFPTVFEKLSAPDRLSFYQREERDLLQLKKYSGKKLIKRLKEHQQKYFFVLNSYAKTKMLSVNYFQKRLNEYATQKSKSKINELILLPQKVKKQKRLILKQYKLSQEIAKISDRLSFCIWWQDLRKYYIFLINHYITMYLKEIARRYKIRFDDLLEYNHLEILKLLEYNKKLSTAEVVQRKKGLVFYYSMNKNNMDYFSGPKAREIITLFNRERISNKVSEIRGLVVSGGKRILASVRVITSAAQAKKMKSGEVLVAPMTSPDYIVAMRKASAVITDEGGMTSHAAIVSRELKIPCIVGTKIATKVLRDGMKVEVNTVLGVVKIL